MRSGVALPIYGSPASRREPGPPAASPWYFATPGGRFVFVVSTGMVFEVDAPMHAGLLAGDVESLRELREHAGTRREEAHPMSDVSALTLHLTKGCNLSCTYCYADGGRFGGGAGSMSRETVDAALVRHFRSAGGRAVSIGFLGGEPFACRELLWWTVDRARDIAVERDVRVSFGVTTNGTLLRDDDVARLREGGVTVSVSLDGDEAQHDHHRRRAGGGGSWRHIVDALEPLFRDRGRCRLIARATVARDDLDVATRVKALVKLGFDEVGVSPVRDGSDGLRLTGNDHLMFGSALVAAARADEERAQQSGRLRFSNYATALRMIHRGEVRTLPCGAGDRYVSLSAEGRYYTCHRGIDDPNYFLGDLSTGPSSLARAAFLSHRQVGAQYPCNTCWARSLCGGGCHVEVARVGRDGCDAIRDWLAFCIERYGVHSSTQPTWFRAAVNGAS